MFPFDELRTAGYHEHLPVVQVDADDWFTKPPHRAIERLAGLPYELRRRTLRGLYRTRDTRMVWILVEAAVHDYFMACPVGQDLWDCARHVEDVRFLWKPLTRLAVAEDDSPQRLRARRAMEWLNFCPDVDVTDPGCFSPDRVSQVVSRLRDPDPWLRLRAIHAIEHAFYQVGDGVLGSLDRVAEEDPDPDIRRRAAWAVYHKRQSRALCWALRLERGRAMDVEQSDARAPDDRLLDELLFLLSSPLAGDRMMLGSSLQKCAQRLGVKATARLLDELKKDNPRVRGSILYTLAELKDHATPQWVGPVLAVIANNPSDVSAAAHLFKSLGETAISELEKLMTDRTLGQEAARMLIRLECASGLSRMLATMSQQVHREPLDHDRHLTPHSAESLFLLRGAIRDPSPCPWHPIEDVESLAHSMFTLLQTKAAELKTEDLEAMARLADVPFTLSDLPPQTFSFREIRYMASEELDRRGL